MRGQGKRARRYGQGGGCGSSGEVGVAFTIRPIGLLHAPRPRARAAMQTGTLELFEPAILKPLDLSKGAEIWVAVYGGQGQERLPAARRKRCLWTLPSGAGWMDRPPPIKVIRARILTLDLDQGCLQIEGAGFCDGIPIFGLGPAPGPS